MSETEFNLSKEKAKLQKLGDMCVDLAKAQGKATNEFYELFEKIYGIEFDWDMDSIVEVISYGNASFSIKELEEEIIFLRNRHSYNFDTSKLKNVEELKR